MTTTSTDVRTLLFGLALLMVGNGLQGTLLGVRATLEGFSTTATGVVMTGYFAGFLVGSVTVPGYLNAVGHVRVFAALASLASASVLLHAVLVHVAAWTAIRLVTGFAYAGLYVVAESWLNDAATNATRGRILSLYMVVVMGGMASGQLLLNVADPAGSGLFILVSVLVSLAVVPVALSVAQVPAFDAPDHLGLRALYRISPLGVVGITLTGLVHGAVFGMGAVYARQRGLSVAEVSWFMAAIVLGGVVCQWPIGRLSDRYDRRRVIAAVSATGTAATAAGVLDPPPLAALLIGGALAGGMAIPLYALFIAHTNDHLAPRQMVAASAGLMLAGGMGLSLGPVSAGWLMARVGPEGFLWLVTGGLGSVCAYCAWRMGQRAPVPASDQHIYTAAPAQSSPVAAAISSRTVRDSGDRDASGNGPR